MALKIKTTADPSVDCEAARCPLCGRPNHCQLCTAAAFKGPCWCAAVEFPAELLAGVPADQRNRACICHSCVADSRRGPSRERISALRAGDFYFDGSGLMVFTARYHLRRGFCCQSNCRHCPYPSSSA